MFYVFLEQDLRDAMDILFPDATFPDRLRDMQLRDLDTPYHQCAARLVTGDATGRDTLNKAFWTLNHFIHARITQQRQNPHQDCLSTMLRASCVQDLPAATTSQMQQPGPGLGLALMALPVVLGRLAIGGWDRVTRRPFSPADTETTQKSYLLEPLGWPVQTFWRWMQEIEDGFCVLKNDFGKFWQGMTEPSGESPKMTVQPTLRQMLHAIKPHYGLGSDGCLRNTHYVGHLFARLQYRTGQVLTGLGLVGMLSMAFATQQVEGMLGGVGEHLKGSWAHKARTRIVLLANHKPEQLVPEIMRHAETAYFLQNLDPKGDLARVAMLIASGAATVAGLGQTGKAGKQLAAATTIPPQLQDVPQMWQYHNTQAQYA